MNTVELAFVLLTITAVLSSFGIAILVAVSKAHILEMDRIVKGEGTPRQVDFYLLRGLRATDYAFASLFRWCARRTMAHVDFSCVPPYLVRRFRIVGNLYLLFIASLGMSLIAARWL